MRAVLDKERLSFGIAAILVFSGCLWWGCGRYEHANPYDPKYTGDSPVPYLRVVGTNLIEDHSDNSYRYFWIQTSFRNLGPRVTDVEATITASDDVAHITYNATIEIQQLGPSQVSTTQWPYHFGFRIPKGTKAPADLMFTVAMVGTERTEYSDTIYITIHPAKLRVLGTAVEEYGSSFKLVPSVENSGLGSAISTELKVADHDPRVKIDGYPGVLTLGDIISGDTIVGAAPGEWGYFVVAVADTVQLPLHAQSIFSLMVADSTSWLDTCIVVIPRRSAY
jgi:hypothetical protein